MNEFLQNDDGLSDEEIANCCEALRLWEENSHDEERKIEECHFIETERR